MLKTLDNRNIITPDSPHETRCRGAQPPNDKYCERGQTYHYIHIYMYVYTYIHIERERDTLCIYIYMYTHICICQNNKQPVENHAEYCLPNWVYTRAAPGLRATWHLQ